MKRTIAAALGFFICIQPASVPVYTAEKAPAAVNEVFNDESLSSSAIDLNTLNHTPYVKTDSLNRFRPDDYTTREEAAGMLYELLTDKGSQPVLFDDVSPDNEFYNEIGTVASCGLMYGRSDGLFHPKDTITRGEFAAIICNIFSIKGGEAVFTDLNDSYWEAPYIKAAADAGYMSGYSDGSFLPRKQITRAEAVSAFNRILNRTCDPHAAERNDLLIMPDVVKEHWAYNDILEATTSHVCGSSTGETWLSCESKTVEGKTGFISIGCNLYYIDENTHQYVHDKTEGNFIFDQNGRYTTGSLTLDDCLNSVIGKITTDKMTEEEKLFACYEYIRDNFKYQKGSIYNNGSTGWDIAEAEKLFTKGKGNCYSFAAGFTHLARKIGYNAIPIAGQVPHSGGGLTAHGWTEITIGQTTYIFDPELAMANGYNLFKKTYTQTPFTYYK